MTYIPLHLKYRPQTFDALIGQEVNAKIIQKAIANNKIPNAFLLYGQFGGGKTSTARIISKALNCLNPVNGNPCNKCNNCIDITKDKFLDVIEIDAASHSGVDDARIVAQNANYEPKYGRYKVYIIDEAHTLSPKAFDSLLKVIEEPSSKVKFIFCTTNFAKIPNTIKSRSMVFYFKPISKQDITNHLNYICKKEHIELDKVVEEIADRTQSFRDALIRLEQCIALKDDPELLNKILMRISIKEIEDFINLLTEGKSLDAIHYIKDLRFPVEDFLTELSSYVCNVIENQDFSKLNQEQWIDFLKTVGMWRVEYSKSFNKTATNDLNIFDLVKFLFKENKPVTLLSHAEAIAKMLDGMFKKTDEEHYIVTTKKGNQLHLIADVSKMVSGYYCLFPIDTAKIINSKKTVSELIKEGIIRKR